MKKIVYLLVGLFLVSCEYDETGLNDSSSYLSTYTGVGRQMDFSGEQYNKIEENPFVNVEDTAVSTFSIDADGGAYSNMRRFLNFNQLPPKDAVRTEEYINYFEMDYDNPTGEHPIALNGEVGGCPWNPDHKLIRIGIKGRSLSNTDVQSSNLVLLLDVSGSMASDDKLPLLKEGLKILVDEFKKDDKISIVTYAGSAGIVLKPTSGDEKGVIKSAINKLGAGGSTAGAAGILTAYQLAEENFIEGGNNRVILATDGDFNVGISDQESLIDLIEEKRASGIFLTTIGLGTGNLMEGMMEQLANNGNGTYEYMDNLGQAEKVFKHEYSKFFTIAKDVKVQVEFNPEVVKSYRLIGYENRLLENSDFEDDDKDAGEIGADQTITALYEIIPATFAPAVRSAPTFTIKFRYKKPNEDISRPITLEIMDYNTTFDQASENMRFSASVAAYAMLLRGSKYRGDATYDKVIKWTQAASNFNPHGYKTEFLELVKQAKAL